MAPQPRSRGARQRAAIGERWQRLFGSLAWPVETAGPLAALFDADPAESEGLSPASSIDAALLARGEARTPRLTPVAVGAVALVAALGLAWAGWLTLRSTPQAVSGPIPVSVSGSVAGRPAPTSASPGSASPATTIIVDVAGLVRRPGLVRLPPGARVADALAAAGGPLRGVDLTALNLARIVIDGEQVLVGVSSGATGGSVPGGAGPAGGATSGGTTGGLVDLNSATLEQLEALPGVGPVLAQRILDFRLAHQRFSSIDELREVSGIGERKYADIAPKVRIA